MILNRLHICSIQKYLKWRTFFNNSKTMSQPEDYTLINIPRTVPPFGHRISIGVHLGYRFGSINNLIHTVACQRVTALTCSNLLVGQSTCIVVVVESFTYTTHQFHANERTMYLQGQLIARTNIDSHTHTLQQTHMFVLQKLHAFENFSITSIEIGAFTFFFLDAHRFTTTKPRDHTIKFRSHRRRRRRRITQLVIDNYFIKHT